MLIEHPQRTPWEAGTTPTPENDEALVLHLHTREVTLLLDILEAALPTEKITGLHTRNPALSHFFNSVYEGVLSSAREQGWGET